MPGGLRKLRRQFVHERAQAAHGAHLADLCLEVVEIETFAGLELFGERQGLFFIDALSGFFDQRQDVAHAKNARGHALGVEGFQAGELFADASKLDRLAGDVAHR